MNRSDWPAHVLILNDWELNRWLSRFVLEIRQRDGKEYPVNTQYQICCGILRYIRELKPQLDIFRDAAFARFYQTLDAEMKRLKAGGLGVHTKQAEPITPDEEELLWSTLVYLCVTYFSLRSVKEH